MVDNFPGPKTRAAPERGIPLFRNGLKFDTEMARAIRGRMLEQGVWAISDRQDTIRMYPALNMDESVLREGLKIMEDAIRHVEEQGHTEGDVAAYPCGNAGF